ncbi:MAG: YdcF family protein [archaeon]|nr:YdcF family protein [archaeon]
MSEIEISSMDESTSAQSVRLSQKEEIEQSETKFNPKIMAALSLVLLLGVSLLLLINQKNESKKPIINISSSYSNILSNTNADVKTLAKNLILYYRDHREKADTDLLRLLQEMKGLNETEYIYWDKVMKFWKFVNNKMIINTDVVPEDLPTDDSVCIIVLGYGLNADGSMKPELIKRLTTAYNLATAYPKSFIAVTGGPTASQNKTATEGGQMGKWLLAKGIAADRVIIEDKAMSTVQNAQYVYKKLVEEYTQVNKIIMVTSDYHIPRGCLLYNTQLLKSFYEEDGPMMEIISNSAAYISGKRESDSLMASSVAGVAGISISGSTPSLSKLTEIKAEGNMYYLIGETPTFKVTATYNTDFSREVSELAEIGEYDNTKVGKQTVEISYTENSITKKTTMEIYFSK